MAGKLWRQTGVVVGQQIARRHIDGCRQVAVIEPQLARRVRWGRRRSPMRRPSTVPAPALSPSTTSVSTPMRDAEGLDGQRRAAARCRWTTAAAGGAPRRHHRGRGWQRPGRVAAAAKDRQWRGDAIEHRQAAAMCPSPVMAKPDFGLAAPCPLPIGSAPGWLVRPTVPRQSVHHSPRRLRRCRRRQAIGFGKQHVERNRRGAQFGQPAGDSRPWSGATRAIGRCLASEASSMSMIRSGRSGGASRGLICWNTSNVVSRATANGIGIGGAQQHQGDDDCGAEQQR